MNKLIAGGGIAVFDNFLGQDGLLAVRADAESFAARGGLRPAGMGRGGTAWTERRARGDEIAWLHGSRPPPCKLDTDSTFTPESGSSSISQKQPAVECGPALQELVDRMLSLQGDLGPSLAALPQRADQENLAQPLAEAAAADLRIDRAALQLAWYRPGGRYVRHSDVGPGAPAPDPFRPRRAGQSGPLC